MEKKALSTPNSTPMSRENIQRLALLEEVCNTFNKVEITLDEEGRRRVSEIASELKKTCFSKT